MWTCSLFVRKPRVTSGHASDRAGLHRRQLGAFVIEPANFGKWFDAPPAALECVLMSTGPAEQPIVARWMHREQLRQR
jgi:hypothetical protein